MSKKPAFCSYFSRSDCAKFNHDRIKYFVSNLRFFKTKNNFIKKLLLLLQCCKAVAAIYRSVIRGSKGDLCFLAAACADSSVHFSGSLGSFLLFVSASFASLGLVLESAGCVKFLLAGGENKFSTALFAYKSLVFVHKVLPRLKK